MPHLTRRIVAAALVSAGLFASTASAATSPAIWVGSPVNGTWGAAGSADTLPAVHHKLSKLQNDWAVDLSAVPGNDLDVNLYVAPSNNRYNAAVTTKVAAIVDDNACRRGGGGDFVVVGIYYRGALYGHATYAHLDRDPGLYTGKTIPRWGARLGSVAQLSGAATGGPDCWTGPHVHFELRARKDYA